MYKIEVDADSCIGCSACTVLCSKGFRMEANKSVPTSAEVEAIECEQKAADDCPTGSIKILAG